MRKIKPFIFAYCKIKTKFGYIFLSTKFNSDYIVLHRFDDKYNLVLSCKDGKTGALREASLTKSVACFIDETGVIVYDLIEPEVSKLHNSLLSERKDK